MKRFVRLLSLLFIGVVIAAFWLDLEASTAHPTRPSAPPTQVPANPSPQDWIQIMQSPPDCELSCWWGVTPGETQFSEIESIYSARFADVAFRRFEETFPNSILAWNFNAQVAGSQETFPIISVLVEQDNQGVVEFMRLSPLAATDGNPQVRATVARFSTLNLIAQLGTPSAFVSDVRQLDTVFIGGDLWFFWGDQGNCCLI